MSVIEGAPRKKPDSGVAVAADHACPSRKLDFNACMKAAAIAAGVCRATAVNGRVELTVQGDLIRLSWTDRPGGPMFWRLAMATENVVAVCGDHSTRLDPLLM